MKKTKIISPCCLNVYNMTFTTPTWSVSFYSYVSSHEIVDWVIRTIAMQIFSLLWLKRSHWFHFFTPGLHLRGAFTSPRLAPSPSRSLGNVSQNPLFSTVFASHTLWKFLICPSQECFLNSTLYIQSLSWSRWTLVINKNRHNFWAKHFVWIPHISFVNGTLLSTHKQSTQKLLYSLDFSRGLMLRIFDYNHKIIIDLKYLRHLSLVVQIVASDKVLPSVLPRCICSSMVLNSKHIHSRNISSDLNPKAPYQLLGHRVGLGDHKLR